MYIQLSLVESPLWIICVPYTPRSEAEVSISGRVRDGGAKSILKKQLQGIGSFDEFVDLKTGAIKSKKKQKVKSPEEEAQAEMKKLEKKQLNFHLLTVDVLFESFVFVDCESLSKNHLRQMQMFNDIPACIQQLEKFGVRNRAELVACLHYGRSKAFVTSSLTMA